MNHLPVRLRTSGARSAIAGLLALSLSASAGMVVAAPAVLSPVPVSTLATGTGPTAASSLGARAAVVSRERFDIPLAPPSPAVTVLSPTAVAVPPGRPQVAARPRTLAAATTPRPAAPKVVRKPAPVAPRTVTVSYHGVYHLWIPALSLSRDIDDWGCNGGVIPNHVEYWGCAGHDNLYLLGHAWGVFAKIHDGYHSGALRAGLAAWYADKAGRVHRYRIAWVRHVRNADYASWSQWAMAASSGPIITLQTCDGPTSAYRILVRLVPA